MNVDTQLGLISENKTGFENHFNRAAIIIIIGREIYVTTVVTLFGADAGSKA